MDQTSPCQHPCLAPAARSLRATLTRAALLAAAAAVGCAGYQIGNQNLFRPDVRTIHVPVFESDSYRRSLAEWLTEAVAKEIELSTPYRVTAAAEADSVLLGRIVHEEKNVVFEDPNDLPRSLESRWLVEVRWQGPQGNLLRRVAHYPIPFDPVLITERATLIPEAGQSVLTAHQQIVEQIAQQIVSEMEMAW